jgi:heptosyltransferase-3
MSMFRKIRHRVKMILNFVQCWMVLTVLRSGIAHKKGKDRIIGILLIEHMGDIIACEPIARYVRQKNPDAYIIWFIRREYVDLLTRHPSVDRIMVLHCLSVKESIKRMNLLHQHFDLHFAERYCALCHPHGVPRTNHNVNKIALNNFYSYGNILQAFSTFAGMAPVSGTPQLVLPEISQQAAGDIRAFGKHIVVHCSSNTPEKDWGDDNWKRLIDFVIDQSGCNVVEIGTLSKVIRSSHQKYFNRCGRYSIPDTSEVIRTAELYIGVDSGPAHLANAAGTFGILLMGSYLGFSSYNPYSGGYGSETNAKIIRTEGPVRNLSFELVRDVVENIVHQYTVRSIIK